MQKLTDKGYRALLYAITNGKDEISFRLQNEVDSHSDFLEKNLVCLARYRSKYTNHKLLTREKASMRNRSLLFISTFGEQKSVWDNANDLGDKAMLHKIRGPDTKCTDMVADYFKYHMVCMNSYLTRRVHSQ